MQYRAPSFSMIASGKNTLNLGTSRYLHILTNGQIRKNNTTDIKSCDSCSGYVHCTFLGI